MLVEVIDHIIKKYHTIPLIGIENNSIGQSTLDHSKHKDWSIYLYKTQKFDKMFNTYTQDL